MAATGAVRIVACCGHMVTVTGLERHTFETLRAMRARGAAVHCIVNSWENHRITALAESIGATWSIGRYHQTLSRRRVTPSRIARMINDVMRTSLGLLRDVRRTRATAVLMPEHLAVVRNAPALAWLRVRGVRIVMGLGNAPDPGRFYAWYWRVIQNALVDHFVCNSQFTRDELVRHGVSISKISWVHNVLPPERRRALPVPMEQRTAGRVVYIGQIIPGKGVDQLLDAVGLLVARGVDVTLDITGALEGWTTPEYAAYRKRIRERAARPDLAARVRFLGWCDDVMPVLARAALHCAPSRRQLREGFGYVNLEAKQVGVPSVVFPSGAFPEIVTHQVDGWVCRHDTAESLAEGIEYFLASPDRLRAASAAAAASVARFDPEAYAEHWWRVLADHPSH